MDFDDPQEDELLKTAIHARLVRMGTAFPGHVVKYDATSSPPRAVIQPGFKYRTTAGELADLPQIHNVPVLFVSGAGGGVTFPVKPGDACLCIVSQRRLDAWLAAGGSKVVDPYQGADQAPELFSINDAIALVGLRFTPADADHVVVDAPSSARVKLGGADASSPVARGDVVDSNFSNVGTWATGVEVFLAAVSTALGVPYPPTIPPATPAPFSTPSVASSKVDTK